MRKIIIWLLSVSLLGIVPQAAQFPLAYAKQDPAIQEVNALRHEREVKMPYLDKGIVRSEINVEKIRDKKMFLSTGKKNLKELMERAVAAYTPARAARERISLARRRILVALRALFPETSFELNDKEGDLSDRAFNSFNYRFKFKQPLFRGGALWNTLLQEKAGLEAAEKEYEASISDVINDISAAYIEYSRAVAVIQSQEKAITQMQHNAQISERKFKEDIISEIEHLNVQSLYSQTRYDHETSKQELELARLELQKLLGLELEDHLEIAPLYQIEDLLARRKTEEKTENEGYDIGPAQTLPSLAKLVDMAYEHRPELQVETAKLESARLEERIRYGKMLPQADATLEFGKLGEAFDDQDLTPSMEREFRFMIELNWNLGGNKVGYTYEDDQRAPTVSQFLGGSGSNIRRNTLTMGLLDSLKDFADAKEAEVLRLDQVVQLEKKEKEVIQDVKKSYFDYQKARIQVKSSLQRVDYRQRLEKLSKHKLEKNEIQISEYLQTQIDLLQELTTLHKAVADYYTAKAKLNHAIGVRNFFQLEGEQGGTEKPVRKTAAAR